MKFPRTMMLVCAGSALALAACNKGEEAPKAAAGGELLPRSASDDMLPYDTLRSQASLSAPDAGLYQGSARRQPEVMATALPEDDVVSDEVPAGEEPAAAQ